MHIDFATPSNGTYNNVGSSRQLANYMEHEDLERMEKGIYIDGFFNLKDDNIYKSKVIKDIDTNIGQLLKTDAKFYAIHVSPSEKEIRAIGNTEQEQSEAMKRYIRKVFIPEYAKNFNKELSASDIKFYGKIHFDRSRSDNELNMHCHLIVSRKDQANKKKLSPLTSHKNTKKGVIKGGFDRVNLFQQVEQGFDRLFSYDRYLVECFDYYNTMKTGSMTEQLKLQEQEARSSEREMEINQEIHQDDLPLVHLRTKEAFKNHNQLIEKQNRDISINPLNYKGSNSSTGSSFSFIPPEMNSTQPPDIQKKLKRRFKKKK